MFFIHKFSSLVFELQVPIENYVYCCTFLRKSFVDESVNFLIIISNKTSWFHFFAPFTFLFVIPWGDKRVSHTHMSSCYAEYKLRSARALVAMSDNFCILIPNHHSTYTNPIWIFHRTQACQALYFSQVSVIHPTVDDTNSLLIIIFKSRSTTAWFCVICWHNAYVKIELSVCMIAMIQYSNWVFCEMTNNCCDVAINND